MPNKTAEILAAIERLKPKGPITSVRQIAMEMGLSSAKPLYEKSYRELIEPYIFKPQPKRNAKKPTNYSTPNKARQRWAARHSHKLL